MEIYKLSDEIPDEKSGRRRDRTGQKQHGELTNKQKCDILEERTLKDAGVSDGVLRITDIRQAVRNENRVNIDVNGKYAFSLDIAQVVEMGVKVGKEVSLEELTEYKKASEFGKVYQRALEWALMRPRSVRELRDYLKRRKRTAEMKERQREWEETRGRGPVKTGAERGLVEVGTKKHWRLSENGERGGWQVMKEKERLRYDFDDLIVAKLCERGYVDDEKFARYYIENRFTKKGISQKRMRQELAAKGVAAEVIEAVLAESGRDEVGEIRKMIAKKRDKYDDAKLIAYLCRQGFSYELVSEQVRSCGRD